MSEKKVEHFNNLNQNVRRKKSIIRHIIRVITIILFISVYIINLFLLIKKIDNLEYKIIATIINTTDNIVSSSECIANSINNLLDGVLEENSVIPNSESYFKIINRTEWGAADSTNELVPLIGPIGIVIIAHTETHECNNFDTCKLQMNILQLFFTQLRNFEDIGYNFLIGGDGAVYEGIGWDYIGHHTRGYNDNSIGIGFIGNYQNKTPTENQLSAATLLLNYGLENNHLERNYVIKGQKDLLPIVSPGENLYNRIKTWEHFFQKYL